MRWSLFLILVFVMTLSIQPFSEEWEFSEPKLALDVGAPGEFDSLFVSDPCVIKVSENKYYMYYTGYGDDEKCRIGLAESTTGETWTKVGMVLDSGILTDLGVIDLMEPCVIIDEAPKNNILEVEKGTTIFRMWYAANTHEDNFIFYAESLDGLIWQQKVLPVYGRLNGEKRVREPWIIKENNSYLMWYSNGESVNLLKSKDGFKWHYIGNFLRAGERGKWTSRGIFSFKVSHKDNAKMFLCSGRDDENAMTIHIGELSKDNRMLNISEEPVIEKDEASFKYGAGGTCGMSENGNIKIWFTGINSEHPSEDGFMRVFLIEGRF